MPSWQEKVTRGLQAGSACLLVLLLMLSATGCAQKPLNVHPAKPVPPARLILPRSLTDPLPLPKWLLSPVLNSTSLSQPLSEPRKTGSGQKA